ncbi:MAG TPA: MFS transporter [Candidatus Polarisedimenticolia bacterium]|nr:MFS transporter [Candidatus Polarisedimenticolia bacterium]
MIARLLRRVVDVEDGEVGPVLWACVYCFFVLASFYVMRPLREEMGIAGGIKNLPKLYLGTLAATILTVPLFSALVSRLSRRRFIPIAYRFFALNLVGFFLLFRWLPEDSRVIAARVFYVWLSVFNLFVVSVFWGYMADIFTSGQGKRLFGLVAAGGTLGGIAGATFTAMVVERVGLQGMFLIAALVVEAAVQSFQRLDRMPLSPGSITSPSLDGVAANPAAAVAKQEERLDRTGWLGGFTAVVRSPYLLLYCLFMLLFTNTSTFAYLEQARFVKAASTSPEARTVIFAQIDEWVNILALLVQLFLTGRLVKWLGLGAALCILPLVSLGGFGALLLWPTLTTLMVFQVLRRGGDYAVSKPAREVLFTVIPREQKYKAKSFIDTFVYRGGDALNANVYDALTAGGGDPASRVALFSIPVTALWIAVSLGLSRRQQRLAAAPESAPVASIPSPATAG